VKEGSGRDSGGSVVVFDFSKCQTWRGSTRGTGASRPAVDRASGAGARAGWHPSAEAWAGSLGTGWPRAWGTLAGTFRLDATRRRRRRTVVGRRGERIVVAAVAAVGTGSPDRGAAEWRARRARETKSKKTKTKSEEAEVEEEVDRSGAAARRLSVMTILSLLLR